MNDKAVCRIVGAHDKDEIKQIAAAYDKKYGVTLKGVVASKCKGDYKRLAVAWIDLPDQLAQPDKRIELPHIEKAAEEAAAESAAAGDAAGAAVDDEISDEDDVPYHDSNGRTRPLPVYPVAAAAAVLWLPRLRCCGCRY